MTAGLVLLALAVLLAPTPGGGSPPGSPSSRSAALSRARPGRRDGGSAAARPMPREVAETTRLLAAALRAGVGLGEALEVVADLGPPGASALRVVVAAQRWGVAPDRAWQDVDAAWAPVARAVSSADEAGISPVRALEAAAEGLDRDRRTRAVAAVRQVEVLVVLPLGLAFLPGFVLTTVVPVVMGLATGLLVR